MWSNYILFLTFLTFYFSNGQVAKEGFYCRMASGRIGRCKKLQNCKQTQIDYSNNKKWPTFCRSSWTLVCCGDLKETKNWVRTRPTTTATTTTAAIPTITARVTPKVENRFGYGWKSNQRCIEYSKWLWPPILMLGAEKIPGVCGISIEPTIVGGKKAGDLEFPHMAKLEYKDPITLCGATLISEKFLLTAGHCLKNKEGPVRARLGIGETRSQITVTIAEQIPHPEFVPGEKYNDIALLRLERPLPRFSDYMRPACLQTAEHIEEERATASGWGYKEHEGEVSEILMKVNLPFVKYSNCSRTYPKNSQKLARGLDESTMICAGGYETRKDTCQGDSGGPLQIGQKDPSCMYHIIGITSFGDNCGLVPGVYTRVSHYIPWIESIVWPDLG